MKIKKGDLVKVRYFNSDKVYYGAIIKIDNAEPSLPYYFVQLFDGYSGWWSLRQIEVLNNEGR